MTRKQLNNAWRLLGYIEGAIDTDLDTDAHDIIQEAVNELAEILETEEKEAGKK